MSTMALADLSREARRSFGLEADCELRCRESTRSRPTMAMIPTVISPHMRHDHGRIPLRLGLVGHAVN
jgi:hypothetical protein